MIGAEPVLAVGTRSDLRAAWTHRMRRRLAAFEADDQRRTRRLIDHALGETATPSTSATELPDHEQIRIDLRGEVRDLGDGFSDADVDVGGGRPSIRHEALEPLPRQLRKDLGGSRDPRVIANDRDEVQIGIAMTSRLIDRMLEDDLGVLGVLERDDDPEWTHECLGQHDWRVCIACARSRARVWSLPGRARVSLGGARSWLADPGAIPSSATTGRDYTTICGGLRSPTLPPPTHAIRRVLDQRELKIAYQPIVDLATRKIFAYEALARPTAPEFPNPVSLFTAAVQHSCTGELGALLRELSIAGCAAYPLFINIHPSELNERWIIQPNDALYTHDREVFLEITEGVPLSHFHLCQTILAEVRGRGVHLVVDDLGAGYSNLKYIADLHPRVVKLDRGLVAGLTTDSRMFKLISGMVVLCTQLDALVVAEGIETVTELDAVMEAGCHLGQGYLLARPAFPPPAVTWPDGGGTSSRPASTKRASTMSGTRR